MKMNYDEAIAAIKSNYPDSRYTMLREALDMSILLLEDKKKQIELSKDMSLVQKFADLAHKQWSGWMVYLFSKSTKNEDGTVTIPKWAVDRWEKQIDTEYKDLTSDEQWLDVREANKFIDVLVDHM
jgi:hypothetical protein